MDELPKTYYLESVEQLRAVSDNLRIRILEALESQPMTVTQLGERLGLAPAKVHYHVRELERVGLVRLVETREKGGVLEKYYRSIAQGFSVPASLLRTAPPDEVLTAVSGMLQRLSDGILRALARRLRAAAEAETAEQAEREAEEGELIEISSVTAFMTNDEARQVSRQVFDLLNRYGTRRGIAGEHEYTLALTAYVEEASMSGREAPSSAAMPSEPASLAPPEPRRVVVAGILVYSRADLARVAERGEQLDLHVRGHLGFAKDVTADLAERTIASVRHTGTLSAPAEVRAVLKRKQKPS